MRTRSLAGAAASAFALSLLVTTPASAHESRPAGESLRALSVTTTQDSTDARPGDGTCADAAGRCSLRAAVQEANASGGGSVVLGQGTYRLTLRGAGEDAAATGDLDVTSRVVLDGRGARIDGQRLDRVLDVLAGGSLTLRDVTVSGGAALGTGLPASGGGVRNAGTLVVDRSTVTGNSAVRAGGGIEASPGSTTTVDRSTLSGNSTGAGPGNGGGLHLTGAGTVHVERSTVSGNTAAAEGGGLWNSGAGTMTVDRTTVSGNTASGAEATMGGGGLFQEAGPTGTLTVTRSEVTGNIADGAAGSGGGILNDQATLVVERTRVERNSAARAGGGIEANVGRTTLERTDLVGNVTGAAPGNGGGLHLTGAGTVRIDRGEVTGNRAANDGGGLWNSPTGTMTAQRTAIRGNTAAGEGDDVYQEVGPDGTATGTFTVDGRRVPAGG
ncbi:right-handed parallel beta-helix repeat-containing protein [Modestobacter lacusdianchii]